MEYKENNKKIKNALDENFSSVFLSENEKSEMLKNIHKLIKPQPSPFYENLNIFNFNKHKIVYAYSLSLLLIFSGGFGIVSASNKSLPGDFLYPVKTNIIEEITYNLKPEDKKIEYAGSLIQKRVSEIKEIKENKTDFTQETFEIVEDLITRHADKLNNSIENVDNHADTILTVVNSINDLEEYIEISEQVDTNIKTESTIIDSIEIKTEEVQQNLEEYVEDVVEVITEEEYNILIDVIEPEEVIPTKTTEELSTEKEISKEEKIKKDKEDKKQEVLDLIEERLNQE